MSANTWMKRAKANKIGIFFMFMLVLLMSIPAKIVEAQDRKPEIPRPQFIEPFPHTRDTTLFGETTTIGSPLASSITTRVLDAGDSLIHGLIYYDNYLWASTRTTPGRILKINPTTLAVESRIVLPTGLDYAEDITAVNGYIWSITSTEPTYLIKINPSTLAYTITTLDTGGTNYLDFAESMEYSFGKLWVGGVNAIAEVDISTTPPTFVVHYYSELVDSEFILGTALTSDANYLWAIYGQRTVAPPYIAGSTVMRIDPSNPGSSYIHADLTTTFPDDMVYSAGFLFTSTEEPGLPSYAYRFPDTVIPYDSVLADSTSISYGTFMDQLSGSEIWGSFTSSPGIIKKFDLSLNNLWTFQLPTGFDDPSEIVFDSEGNMYVSTFQEPSGMVKFTPPEAVTINASKSGNDLVLSWTNSDAYVDHYEVWRSTNPYFIPGDVGSTKISDVPAELGGNVFTDTGVLGDVNTHHFYIIRAFNAFGLVSPISNRIGEIEFSIEPATTLNKYTHISLPLDMGSSITKASELVSYIGSGVQRVLKWDITSQRWIIFRVGTSTNNFDLFAGDSVLLLTDSSAPAMIAFVGQTPSPGSIGYTIGLGYTNITIPLDQDLDMIYNASTLTADINSGGGAVTRALSWDGANQRWIIFRVGTSTNNFSTKLGYPYLMLNNNATVWP